MNTLVIFRRPEIWILMIVSVALAFYAFRSEEAPEIAEEKKLEPIKVLPEKKPVLTEETPEINEVGLTIEKIEIEGTQEGSTQRGIVIDLTLLGQSATDAEAPITEETLTARTGAGDPVPHFFEPFKVEQSLLPGEDSLVTVRLWLEQPADSISLDFQGRTVKTDLPR